jgi:hypothetical protein
MRAYDRAMPAVLEYRVSCVWRVMDKSKRGKMGLCVWTVRGLKGQLAGGFPPLIGLCRSGHGRSPKRGCALSNVPGLLASELQMSRSSPLMAGPPQWGCRVRWRRYPPRKSPMRVRCAAACAACPCRLLSGAVIALHALGASALPLALGVIQGGGCPFSYCS